jgi:hypothetical protein
LREEIQIMMRPRTNVGFFFDPCNDLMVEKPSARGWSGPVLQPYTIVSFAIFCALSLCNS